GVPRRRVRRGDRRRAAAHGAASASADRAGEGGRAPPGGHDSRPVEKARALYEELRSVAVVEYDASAAIGKRYRRQDEIGTPWAFTIDHDTLEDGTVTIRDRDSLAQERIPLDGVRKLLQERLEGPWAPRTS